MENRFSEDLQVQVGNGYHDFDEYFLSSIEVHAPSEHTLRQASWAMEVQFWHVGRPEGGECDRNPLRSRGFMTVFVGRMFHRDCFG